MARRGRSEGSIFKASTGQWIARVELGFGPDGKRQRKEFRTKTRAEARERLDLARRQINDNKPLPPERLKVGAYLDDWAESLDRRPRTLASYREIIKRHLGPGLGGLKLKELSAPAIRRYLALKLKEGQSPASVKYHHAILSSALSQAVDDGLIGTNVAKLVKPPTIDRHEIKPLSLEEAQRLLAAAKGDSLEALFTVALAVGLRQGECFGLRWSDLDLDSGTLMVRQTVQRIEGKLRFTEPKTAKSRRTLPLPGFAVQALREHRVRQLEERLGAGPLWEDHNLVFCTVTGTPLAKENIRRRHWLPLLKRAELPSTFRFHDLRHSCASLLHAQGADLRLIMEVLGHANIATTSDTYTHVFARVKQEAAERMAAAFADASGGAFSER